MSVRVPVYVLYLFGALAAQAVAVEIDAASDEEAIALAQRRADGREMELWGARRLVRRFPAAAAQVSPTPAWPTPMIRSF